MKPELVVKGGYAVNFAGCEVKVPSHHVDGFRGQVSEFFLNPLKNRNKVSTIVPERFKTCGQFPLLFSADLMCHGMLRLLQLDFLHGAVDCLDSVAEHEAKSFKNPQTEGRVLQHDVSQVRALQHKNFCRELTGGGG